MYMLAYSSWRERERWSREYWIIYRGPGFLAVVWLAPPPPPLTSISSTGDTYRKTERERQLFDRRVGGGGVGAKSYDSKNAWSSINHKILFGIKHPKRLHRAFRLNVKLSIIINSTIQYNTKQKSNKNQIRVYNTIYIRRGWVFRFVVIQYPYHM